MARGVNRVTLLGNLGADPETRETTTGTTITNLRLATNESWTDKSGEKQERTEWHRVVTFGKLADICSQYLHKGSSIYIEGKIQTRQWEDKEGATRYTTEVVANEMQMLGGNADAGEGGGRTQRAPRKPRQQEPAAAKQPDFDDDIPF